MNNNPFRLKVSGILVFLVFFAPNTFGQASLVTKAVITTFDPELYNEKLNSSTIEVQSGSNQLIIGESKWTIDYQGTDLTAKYSIGSCLKHFVGYGAVIGGRDYQFSELSERALRETYFPPFEECVKAGAVSMMSAFNDISGFPACANSFTLKQVLRNEWKYKVFVVSDWEAVSELKKHGIAGTSAQAAVAALSAGTDMEMESKCYSALENEVTEKRFDVKIIDEAVKRVLRIKFQIGLFENPFTIENEENTTQLTIENRALARIAAAESMVLLKNENILPIKENAGRITLLGEWANSEDVIGWWTGNGDRKDVVTVADGLLNNLPKGVKLFQTAEPQALNDSTVIVCVGESGNMFGENHSRTELELPWGQTEQVKQLKESGKKSDRCCI